MSLFDEYCAELAALFGQAGKHEVMDVEYEDITEIANEMSMESKKNKLIAGDSNNH